MKKVLGLLLDSFVVAMNVVNGLYAYDKGYTFFSVLSFTVVIASLKIILIETIAIWAMVVFVLIFVPEED